MKSVLLFLVLMLVFVSSLLAGSFFIVKQAEKENEAAVSETISNETAEEVKTEEEKKEEGDQKEETPAVQNEPASQGIVLELQSEKGPVYKMLDFDRRLILAIGQQDQWLCSIFNLAYARAILDNDNKVDPYDYYDGDGAVWRDADFEDVALDNPIEKVLQIAYDEIDAGRPTILFVSGNYGHAAGSESSQRNSGDHYVLLIGYRADADRNDLGPSDFYAADPSGGYCCSIDSYMPWIVLNDTAPEKVSGEYALYASNDPKDHLDTCLAYVDLSNWDADRNEPILPDYAGTER